MVITIDMRTLVEIFAVFGGVVSAVLCVLIALVVYQVGVLKRVGWVLSSLQDLVDMMLDDEEDGGDEPPEPEDPIDQLIQDVMKDSKKKKE